MKIIKELSDMIFEELDGAEQYAKKALTLKEERPELASTFNMIANQEMEHVNLLHKAVADIIAKHRLETGEPPAAMQAIYDYVHEKEIARAAGIRTLMNMYK